MDITGHPWEFLRGDPKLQESAEKKTFTDEARFTPTAPGLTGVPDKVAGGECTFTNEFHTSQM